ncbi:hypothetical protein ABBQ32_002583 [Trebouxia sp. C0010 RCD-2024]
MTNRKYHCLRRTESLSLKLRNQATAHLFSTEGGCAECHLELANSCHNDGRAALLKANCMTEQRPYYSNHSPYSIHRLSPAVKDFLAGAAGGVAGIIAGQPLDVVRVRLQQKAPNAKGLASMWQLIVKQEGMRSLFKGAAYPITTIAMQNAVVFYSYGVGCRWLASKDASRTSTKEPLKLWQVYAAGTFSGLMQTAITTPTELLKIRLQLQTQLPGDPGYVGPLRLLKQVAMREGISGLWRGMAVTLVRDWPSFGVYFAVYEGMQEVLQPGSRASGHISPLALLTAGEYPLHLFHAGCWITNWAKKTALGTIIGGALLYPEAAQGLLEEVGTLSRCTACTDNRTGHPQSSSTLQLLLPFQWTCCLLGGGQAGCSPYAEGEWYCNIVPS